jgi:CxxC-x17-CxxC domain-containing protein
VNGQSIPCAQCGAPFVFSDAERAFFESKGLLPPKRCKACRDARKAERQRPSTAVSWQATCTGCGAPASVPFEPAAGRNVFCARCFRSRDRRDGWQGQTAGPGAAGEAGRAGPLDAADTDAEREVGMPAIIE